MRKSFTTLALTLALLLVSVGIRAQSSTVYLDMDFESCTTGSGNVPSGWSNQDYSAGTSTTTSMNSYLWYVSSSTTAGFAHSGTKYAYLYAYNTYTSASRLKTPAMNLSAAKDAMVSFWLRNSKTTGANYQFGDFSLYVSLDGGATYTQNPLCQHVYTGADWTEYQFSLAAYKGQSITLVFEGHSSGSTTPYAYYYLDDIKVMDAPTCQAPMDPYINGLTGTSATFNWSLDSRFGSVPDQYSVTLKDASGNVVYHNGAVTGSGVNFTNLQGNTTYTAWVRSDCDVVSYSGYSDSVSVEFTTLPDAINPPLVVDFDDWTAIPSGYYYKNAALNATATYAYGAEGKSIKLTTTASDNAYLIFPLLNIAGNNIEMDFFMRRAAAATTTIGTIQFSVGYLTDPSDVAGSFVPVMYDSIAGDASWRNFRFNTSSVNDVTMPVMVCVVMDAAYATSVYLDEVDIHVIPTCTRPEHLTVTDVRDTYVTLAWDMANATTFEVKALNLVDSTVTTYTGTQNPFTVTGLQQNTEYEFTVQGVCSATDSSQVTRPVSAKTLCSVAESTEFIEGAEETTGTAIPDCWVTDYMVNKSTSTAAPFQTSTTTKIGTRAFSIPYKTSGTISYLCSQARNFDQSGKYSFRYSMYRPSGTSYNGEVLKIFVTPTVGDTTNAVEVIPAINFSAGNAPVTTTTGWNEYEGVINYQGVGYIMAVIYCKNGLQRYIDNLEVFLTPSCIKAKDITSGSTTATSFDFSWTPGDDETQWEVAYTLKQGTATVLDTTVITTSASYMVQNLQSATSYTVIGTVRSICGAGDTAEAVNFSFPVKTLCMPIASLPLTMDFENETAGSSTTTTMPDCWSMYNDASGTYNGYPYVYSSTTYFHSGSKGLYFYTTTTTTYADHQMAILPAIDTNVYPVNTLRLKFWAKRSTTTSYADAPMIIGVMSDPSDFTTFEAVDTVVVSNTSDPQEYIVLMSNYTGNGNYIAIRLDRQSTTCYCYMDDITLEEIPNCLDLDGSATISDVTESSVRINLVDLTAATGWSYAYGPAGTAVADMTPVDTVGTSMVLSNLASATSYDLYVRRNCGNGDYSPWAQKVNFSTTAVPATIPYVCGFEDTQENSQWQIVQGAADNNFVVGTVTTAVHSGMSSMYVSKDNGTTNEYANATASGGPSSRNYAYRTIHFDAKGYQVEFYWRCPGGEGTTTIYDYGRVMLLPVSENIPAGSSGTSISSTNQQAGFPASAIMLNPEDKGYMALDGNDWHFESFFVNMTAAPGNYNLVLAWNNDGSGGTVSGPLAVDDITITELTCIPPVSILTSGISSSTVTLSVSQATASEWEFVVDTVAFAKDAVPATPYARINSIDGTASLTGLTPNTEYYYSVRTICGVGDTSAWLDPSSFRTFCAPYAVPYTEGFENASSANCWSVMADESGDATVSRVTTYHESGSASLKAVNAAVISPEFTVDSLTHYMITGWAYAAEDSAQFGVGVIVDPNDASTYENISSVLIPAKNTWTEFTAYFTDLADEDFEDFKYAKNIVLACGSNTIYFDDIIVDLTPDCPKPTEVTLTNIGAHSFDINFVDYANASQWVVYVNGTPNVITTNPATIAGLSAHTNYNVSIAAICAAGDTSYTTDCGSVMTECDVMTLPYSESFETLPTTYTKGMIGDLCWSELNTNATAAAPYYKGNSNTPSDGARNLWMSSNINQSPMYLIMPELAIPANGVRVSFDTKFESATYSGNIYFGYMTDPTVDTTFVMLQNAPRTTGTTAWASYEVVVNTIPAGARFAFKYADCASTTVYYGYLDNVKVTEIRNCSDPNAPTASDVTASTATIQFVDTCAAHAAWEYVYGPIGFDPNAATPVSITTKEFTLSGLTDDTNYEVYVRAVCGANGDVSNYVGGSFKTLCVPFYVTEANHFSESFNDYNYGAYLNTGTCYEVTGEATSNSYWAKVYPTTMPSATATTYYNYGHSDDGYDRCLYWYLYKTSMPDGGTIARQFHLDGGTSYEISAWVRNSTTTSYQTKVSALAGKTVSALDTIGALVVNGASTTSRSVDGHSTYFYNELYQEFKTYFTPDSTGDYFIGFNAAVNTSTYSYLYLDDWTIKPFDGCAYVMPTVDSVTQTTAYVSVDDATFYQFEYVLNDTTLTPTAVTTNTFVINGLSASSSYTLYLRKYCSATTHSEWIGVPFETLCGAVTTLPYTMGFEDSETSVAYSTYRHPKCWTHYNTYATTTAAAHYYPYTSTTYVHSGSKALYSYCYNSTSYADTAILAMPEIDTTVYAMNNLRVKFWARQSTASYSQDLWVGVMTDPDDPSTFVKIGSVTVTGATYEQYKINLTNYRGNGKYIALGYFKSELNSTYSGLYLDDFTVEEIPACEAPEDAPVVASTTMTTMTVEADMARKDTIEFGIAPYVANVTTAAIVDSVISTDGYATFTGLAGNTRYAVWYRYHCGVHGVSDWSALYANGTTMSSDCFAPQNLRTVGVVNDHHAAITWGKAPDAVAYEYKLMRGTVVVDSAANMNDTIVYDSLTANTAYTFKVRTLCATDTSAWQTLGIQTTFPSYELPFICGFEDATQNSGWKINTINAGTNNLVIGNGVSYSGSNSLYVSDDGYSYNYTYASSIVTIVDAEVLLEIPAGNYYVSYDWQCKGESTYDYGRVFLVPSNVTLSGTAAQTYNASLPAGAISLEPGNARLNLQETWSNYSNIVNVPNSNVYKLVVFWTNDGSVANQPPLAIDNIRIEEVSCMPVNSVSMASVLSTSAKAVVNPYDVTVDVEYALSTYDVEDSVSTWSVATGDTLVFNNLIPGNDYYVFVRHSCSATEKSPVKMVAFSTPSNALSLPFVATFEPSDTTVSHWTLTSGSAPNYFVIGNGASYQGNKSLYITDDGTTNSYSGALSWSYAYVPLQFAAGTYEVTYQWRCYGESTFDYGHIMLVPSTMIPQDNVQFGGMAAATIPTGAIALDADFGKLNLGDETTWYDGAAEIVMANPGVYNLVVAWHNDASVYHLPPLAIDNISIRELTCPKLNISQLSLDSASTDMVRVKVSGNEGSGIIYHVASDASFTDTIAYGMTMDSMFTVNNLSASTWYNARLWKYCGVGDTSAVLSVRVRTNCGIISEFPYVEDFESYNTGTSYKTVLDDNCWNVTTTGTSTTSYYYATTTASYVHNGAQALYAYNGSTTGTVQTFAMPRVDTLAGKHLSMWYKNYSTSQSASYALLEIGYLTNPNDNSSFVLLYTAPYVSAYTELNYDYASSIPANARPAFRTHGTYTVYIDDIRLSKIVPGSTYNDTICFGSSYSGYGFNCPAGSLAVGDTILSDVIRSTMAGVADSITTVNLHVMPELVTEYYDTICAGQPYNEGMFNIAQPESKFYFRTFTSSYGCDSTVSLYLTVEESYIVLNDTICEGDVYTLGDQQITTAGTYTVYGVSSHGCPDTTVLHLVVVATTDTITETICQGTTYAWHGQNYGVSGTYMWTGTGLHGCDLTETLVLTVLDGSMTNNVTICAGGSYQFRDTLITTAGTYSRTYYDVTIGCTVTETIIVTVDDVKTADVYDFACEGHTYYGYGVSGVVITKDTVITVSTKTAELCDSITNVHLTYVATQYGDEYVTINEGETYEWYDNTYSEAGTYTETLQSVEGCDSIVTLHLTVNGGEGVENVNTVKVDVVPNPVRPGMTAYVYGEFGEVEAVEILNNFGQIVDRFAPSSYPIEVEGLEVEGLYYVRVITRDGEIYTEKLLVK